PAPAPQPAPTGRDTTPHAPVVAPTQPQPTQPLQPRAPVDECRLPGDTAATRDTVRVALVGSVDSTHAPVPRSDAERLVFRQLYETLVRVDCSGRVTPGLADSWVSSDSGRRWTFSLRRGAQFWDGVPVTARDVLASWRAR